MRKSGEEYGLSLVLYVGQPYDLGFDGSKGIAVFVHEPDTEPDFTSGVLVPVGTYTNLEISQTNYVRLRYLLIKQFNVKFFVWIIFIFCQWTIFLSVDQLNACIRKIAFLEARLDGFMQTSENIEHLILAK